jgi:ABC-type antimicrobial peptide transport system permease subunit
VRSIVNGLDRIVLRERDYRRIRAGVFAIGALVGAVVAFALGRLG